MIINIFKLINNINPHTIIKELSTFFTVMLIILPSCQKPKPSACLSSSQNGASQQSWHNWHNYIGFVRWQDPQQKFKSCVAHFNGNYESFDFKASESAVEVAPVDEQTTFGAEIPPASSIAYTAFKVRMTVDLGCALQMIIDGIKIDGIKKEKAQQQGSDSSVAESNEFYYADSDFVTAFLKKTNETNGQHYPFYLDFKQLKDKASSLPQDFFHASAIKSINIAAINDRMNLLSSNVNEEANDLYEELLKITPNEKAEFGNFVNEFCIKSDENKDIYQSCITNQDIVGIPVYTIVETQKKQQFETFLTQVDNKIPVGLPHKTYGWQEEGFKNHYEKWSQELGNRLTNLLEQGTTATEPYFHFPENLFKNSYFATAKSLKDANSTGPNIITTTDNTHIALFTMNNDLTIQKHDFNTYNKSLNDITNKGSHPLNQESHPLNLPATRLCSPYGIHFNYSFETKTTHGIACDKGETESIHKGGFCSNPQDQTTNLSNTETTALLTIGGFVVGNLSYANGEKLISTNNELTTNVNKSSLSINIDKKTLTNIVVEPDQEPRLPEKITEIANSALQSQLGNNTIKDLIKKHQENNALIQKLQQQIKELESQRLSASPQEQNNIQQQINNLERNTRLLSEEDKKLRSKLEKTKTDDTNSACQ